MIPRYSDPEIELLWTDQSQVDLWGRIEAAMLRAVTGVPVFPLPNVSSRAMRELETATGHEVGAFLEIYEEHLINPLHKRWLHYGLTSSDLVDTARQITLWHTTRRIALSSARLYQAILELEEVPVLGRTHGQVASPTSYRHRWQAASAFLTAAGGTRSRNWAAFYPGTVAWMRRVRPVGMLSGATGRYRTLTREQAERAAESLEVDLVESTQVLPAAYTLEYLEYWLRVTMLCEQIALDMRLGAMLGEASPPSKQVGSTAMPGKVNPIAAEQICGLAKLWRGYYSSWLESRALWLDRDLHHSSLDRVALGDMATLAGYLVNATLLAVQTVELRTSSSPHSTQRQTLQADADRVLGWATCKFAVPRSVAYRAVTEAIRSEPNTAGAMRQIKNRLTESQAPDTVEP